MGNGIHDHLKENDTPKGIPFESVKTLPRYEELDVYFNMTLPAL